MGGGDDPTEIKEVSYVTFEVMSPDTILQRSRCEVVDPNLVNHDGVQRGGLIDRRMGTIEHGFACETCGGKVHECGGHEGHIELATSMYHISFLDVVLRLLRSTCRLCGTLLAPESKKLQDAQHMPMGRKRFLAATKSNNKAAEGRFKCPECENVQWKTDRPNNGVWLTETRTEDGDGVVLATDEIGQRSGKIIYAEDARQRLRRIKDEDVEKLGLNPGVRPEWMILQRLIVPPVTVRPVEVVNGRVKGVDDLTAVLRKIVQENNRLKEYIRQGTDGTLLRRTVAALQILLAQYFNNEPSSAAAYPVLPKKDGTMKTLRQRFKGKEGRVRGNLMGKRVDFSARSVITPDANLALDELGVPRSIAQKLTVPEMVTPQNIAELQQMVHNGADCGSLLGALSFTRKDGSYVDLKRQGSASLHLNVGDTVNRHMRDGDWVIFNRQPSLHKMSMMGHRVRVMDYSTFRLNLSVTTPYNADFDGDEMNLHLPQTQLARAEVEEVMAVPKQIVTAAKNQPVIGLVQDALLASYLVTQRDTFLERDEFFNLVMCIGEARPGKLLRTPPIPPPAVRVRENGRWRKLWTGKQLFSMLLPDITVRREIDTPRGEDADACDTLVRIERGQVLSGRLSKAMLGTSRGSLIQVIWAEHGPTAAADFLSNAQYVLNHWMEARGATVGIRDCVITREAEEQVARRMDKAEIDAQDLIKSAFDGRMKRRPGMSAADALEAEMTALLGEARDEAGEVGRAALCENNGINTIVSAGSKGNHLNITQVAVGVGQQNLMGKRIPHGFRGRTLPHFHRGDLGPAARGFVRSSFINGLAPGEVWLHAVGGREGLVDTAVKTADTGYLQRRLVKGLEDLCVHYDCTVRAADESIVQFTYGEDGLDGQHREFQNVDLLTMSKREANARFVVQVEEVGGMPLVEDVREDFRNVAHRNLTVRFAKEMLDERDALIGWMAADGRKVEDEKRRALPVNVERLLTVTKNKFAVRDDALSNLSPITCNAMLREMLERLEGVHGRGREPLAFFRLLVLGSLAGKRAPCEHRLGVDAFTWLLEELETRFHKAAVEPGEMVGVLAAQSLGEPLTQLTLNTHHNVSANIQTVTAGLPRMKELVGCTPHMSTPSMRIAVAPEVARDERATYRVLAEMVETRLRDVMRGIELAFDLPAFTRSLVEPDREMIGMFFPFDEEHLPVARYSGASVRIHLSTEALVTASMTASDVVREMRKTLPVWSDDSHGRTDWFFYEVHGEDNVPDPVVRLFYFYEESEEATRAESVQDGVQMCRALCNEVPKRHLKGVEGIKRAVIDKIKCPKEVDASGETRVIITEGSNLRGVAHSAAVAEGRVDLQRTHTNDVRQVMEVYGIEAGREALRREINGVISQDGTYVDARHLGLLTDTMCFGGTFMPITRNGVGRGEAGPLTRCTFEQTADILTEAGIYGEVDRINGVSNRIIMGRKIAGGTGMFDTLLDYEMLKDVPPHGSTVPTAPIPESGTRAEIDAIVRLLKNGDLNTPTSAAPIIGETIPAGAMFSPLLQGEGEAPYSPVSPCSPFYRASNYSPSRPPGTRLMYSPSSPMSAPSRAGFGAEMSLVNGPRSPTSPLALRSPTSPSSPNYSPSSPTHTRGRNPALYSPSSPSIPSMFDEGGEVRSVTSPSSPRLAEHTDRSSISTMQRIYGATSPASYSLGAVRPLAVAYSPTSPSAPSAPYSPSSPAVQPFATEEEYDPLSAGDRDFPSYSPSSRVRCPTSPEIK